MTVATSDRVRRERPKPVRLSDAAATRLREIMEQAEGRYAGVRVGVTNGGCAGMSYTMDYAESAGALDEVVEDKGVTFFINPNQTAACGCGESVSITPATDDVVE